MRELQRDDTAVSPVIGVILMVAITVLLASTAAVFFLQFGDGAGPSTPPTAAFDVDYSDENSDEVTFAHESGDILDASELELVIEDAKFKNGSSLTAANGRHDLDSLVGQSKMSAGSSIEVSKDEMSSIITDNADFSEATIEIVWEGSASRSTTLEEWAGPDA